MADDAVQIVLPENASPELIERVREAFPDAIASLEDAAPAAPPGEVLVEEALAESAAAAAGFPRAFADWWLGLPGGALWFLLMVAIALAVGYGVEYGVRRLLPRPGYADERGAPFRRRLPRGLWALVLSLIGIAIFALVSTAVGRVILPTTDYWARIFTRHVLEAILFARVVYSVFAALAGAGAPGRRLMGFDDAEARNVARTALLAMTAFGAVGVLRAMLYAAAPGPAGDMAKVAAIVLGGLITIWFFLRLRAPVTALLARTVGEGATGLAGFAARHWVWIFVAIIIVDVLLKAIGALGLLGAEARDGAGPTIMICTMTPLIVAGLSVWRQESPTKGGLGAGLFVLLEGAVLVGAALLLIRGWGINPLSPPAASGGLAAVLPNLVEAVIVSVVGFALYRTVSALLEGGVKGEEGGLVDEENVGGATRMETILPIVRAIALAAVAVVTILMALAAAGVNIGPLLAGAGVLGLAVGFGAQKLVADVISGLFYLYEDAFRMNEYVETKSGKGVVENIGLRSVRLRHHRGPVFTIPFSDMGTIQNHSRDWVKIKFTFNVPVDTDVEMVRKLVKKVGVALEEDPELEGKFLEPLKSQGAIAIAGRSFTIGCKFTSRPGQQFLIRRKAYAALQKALEEKGISLYMPQLTLNAGDPMNPVAPAGPDGQPMTPAPA
jgi:small-conductance mechanosensitive channel